MMMDMYFVFHLFHHHRRRRCRRCCRCRCHAKRDGRSKHRPNQANQKESECFSFFFEGKTAKNEEMMNGVVDSQAGKRSDGWARFGDWKVSWLRAQKKEEMATATVKAKIRTELIQNKLFWPRQFEYQSLLQFHDLCFFICSILFELSACLSIRTTSAETLPFGSINACVCVRLWKKNFCFLLVYFSIKTWCNKSNSNNNNHNNNHNVKSLFLFWHKCFPSIISLIFLLRLLLLFLYFGLSDYLIYLISSCDSYHIYSLTHTTRQTDRRATKYRKIKLQFSCETSNITQTKLGLLKSN